jgi:ATP-binding cassette, subfamily F, member 3
MSAVPGRDALEARLKGTEVALAEATQEAEQLELATLLAELHEEADHFDAHYGPHRAERILVGLGFRTSDFTRPAVEFSGGWRMRAALAALLLQDPDLLLLDEPTNHLDVPTLAWFDAFLRRSQKAFVLISHDRSFLDRQIRRVVSLELEGVRSWVGNTEDYRRQRAEEYEQLLAKAERVEARRAELQTFVDRFKAKASKASQARSKAKQLEKMEKVVVTQERDTVRFRFPPAPPSGKEVVRIEALHKSFGANVIYRDASAQLLRGQRVAVVGLNGAGKTTLLKMVAGDLTPDAGRIVFGHNVTMGYYAQHQAEALDRSNTIYEEVSPLAHDKPQSFVRGVLGSFLFGKDDIDKPIGVLSGGERARVALAKLLLTPSNFLVMDEPTNHLDLDSSEMLIEALEDYEGTLLFVSHTRSFLDALATHVWDVQAQQVVPYPGNLTEYMAHVDGLAQASQQSSSEPGAASAPVAEKDRKRLEAEARQAKSKRAGPLKKELSQLEATIAKIEAAQKEREAKLADAAFSADYAQSRPVMEAHQADASALQAAYARWEAVSAELESLG